MEKILRKKFKMVATFLVMTLIITILPARKVLANDEIITQPNEYNFTYMVKEDGTIEIVDYIGDYIGEDNKDIIIPDKLFGREVTSVNKDFFNYGIEEKNSVIYPKGIKTIGSDEDSWVLTDCINTISGIQVLPSTVNRLEEIVMMTDVNLIIVKINGNDIDSELEEKIKENPLIELVDESFYDTYYKKEEIEKEFEYEVINNEEIKITRYLGSESKVEIPSTINGYEVVALGEGAFDSSNVYVYDITIPDTVNTLEKNVFNEYYEIYRANLSKNLVNIQGPIPLANIAEINVTPATIEGALSNEEFSKKICNNLNYGRDYLDYEINYLSNSELQEEEYVFNLVDKSDIYYKDDTIPNLDYTSINILRYRGNKSQITYPKRILNRNVYSIDTEILDKTGMPVTCGRYDEKNDNVRNVTISKGIKSINCAELMVYRNLSDLTFTDELWNINREYYYNLRLERINIFSNSSIETKRILDSLDMDDTGDVQVFPLESFNYDNYEYEITPAGTAKVLSCKFVDKNMVLPAVIEGVRVEDASSVFNDNKLDNVELQSLTIPKDMNFSSGEETSNIKIKKIYMNNNMNSRTVDKVIKELSLRNIDTTSTEIKNVYKYDDNVYESSEYKYSYFDGYTSHYYILNNNTILLDSDIKDYLIIPEYFRGYKVYGVNLLNYSDRSYDNIIVPKNIKQFKIINNGIAEYENVSIKLVGDFINKKQCMSLLETMLGESIYVSMNEYKMYSYSVNYPDFQYEVLKDGTLKINKYIGNSEEVKIPTYIYGHKVTALSNDFIDKDKEYSKLYIPVTVKDFQGEEPCNFKVKELILVGKVTGESFDSLSKLLEKANISYSNVKIICDKYKKADAEKANNIDYEETYGDEVSIKSFKGNEKVTEIPRMENDLDIKSIYLHNENSNIEELIIPNTVEYVRNLDSTSIKEIQINGLQDIDQFFRLYYHGIIEGNYDIRTVVDTVAPIKEDINVDGEVDLEDLATIAEKYNFSKDEENYPVYMDLNNDGVINIVDLVLVARRIS